MHAQRLALVSSHSAPHRPFLLRFVESSTRIELAYSNVDQRDAHAAAIILRGHTVTLAYARGEA